MWPKIFFCTILALCLFLSLLAQARIYVSDEVKQLDAVEGRSEKWECVMCTFITGIICQLKQLHQVSANEAFSMLCGYFQPAETFLCRVAGTLLLKDAFRLIDENKTADVVCHALSYCKNEECHLFPRGSNPVSASSLRKIYRLDGFQKIRFCDSFRWLCKLDEPLHPLVDHDGDLFSTSPTFRGSDWRGRDCDDLDPAVYPGRNTSDIVKDENCNGIYGVDNITGRPYEELWCFNSSAMGVIALGDSFTAHFGIPADFVTVQNFSRSTFAHFMSIIADEIDWPMLSSITGFSNASNYKPNKKGSMKSVYSELLKRNRCNHRDYQNLGVNGATTEKLSKLMDVVARDRKKFVKPTFLFLSMIGNDVCDPPPHVTTPEMYYNHLTETLEKAEDILPSGSHVFIAPVVDGRILYNKMHNRTHPIGILNNDVRYDDFYNFLNCVDISPCWGWMNSDEAVRNATWRSAQSLNAQIPRILNESAAKFKNIQVHAFDDIIAGVVKTFNGSFWELVEPVDGFHPSQLGAALLGEYLFKKIDEMGIVPPVNPFNDEIEKRFGDQGGY